MTPPLDELAAHAERLPSLPEVVSYLMRTLNDENADVDTIAQHINADPAIVTRLLAAANSAASGAIAKIHLGAEQAFMVLGIDRVQSIVLASALAYRYDLRGSTSIRTCSGGIPSASRPARRYSPNNSNLTPARLYRRHGARHRPVADAHRQPQGLHGGTGRARHRHRRSSSPSANVSATTTATPGARWRATGDCPAKSSPPSPRTTSPTPGAARPAI